jgi:hypothetical protein
MCPHGNNPEDSQSQLLLFTRRRSKVGAAFLMAVPAWPHQQSLCWFPRWYTRRSMLGRPAAPRLPPRRHIGVTCGGSRTPKVGRCSRERRLIRSAGRLHGETLTGFVAQTGRRGLLTRPSLLFCGTREHGWWNGQLSCPTGRSQHGIRTVHATG